MDSSTSHSQPRSPVPAVRTGSKLLRAVGALLMLVVGAAVCWQAGEVGSAFGVIFGVLVTGLGVLAAIQLVLELQPRGGGARIGTAPDGERATVLPRRGYAPVFSALVLLLLGGCLVAGALVAVRDDKPVLAGVLAVPGLPLLFYLGAVLAGRMPAGCLYLTPTAVVDSHSGSTVRVAWEDMLGVSIDSPIAVLLRPGASVQRTRTAPRGWRGGVRAPEGVLGIEVRQLREDPAVVGYLLGVYRERPDLRDQLGTSASLEWQILTTDS